MDILSAWSRCSSRSVRSLPAAAVVGAITVESVRRDTGAAHALRCAARRSSANVIAVDEGGSE